MESSIDLVSEAEEDEAILQLLHSDEPPFKKRNLFFSTPEQSISFMNVFQKYEVLYGKTFDPSKNVRDHAWSCISDELDIPVNALKARWRCIKDTHTKVKRKKVGTGWYLMQYLGFLDAIKSESNPSDTTLDGFLDDGGTTQNSNQDNDEIDENSQNHNPPDKYDECIAVITPKVLLKQIKNFKSNSTPPGGKQSSGGGKTQMSCSSKPPPLRLIKSAELMHDRVIAVGYANNDSNPDYYEERDPIAIDDHGDDDDDDTKLEDRQINHTVSLEEEEAAYGFHIGRQLRQFPIYEREILRHKINSLIYQAFMNLKSN